MKIDRYTHILVNCAGKYSSQITKINPQHFGDFNKEHQYVKYSDVEKAVNLLDAIKKPYFHGEYCNSDCVHKRLSKGHLSLDKCVLFNKGLLINDYWTHTRCNECRDIFGGE